MHDIMMIPIEALKHHPDNPRKDLGGTHEVYRTFEEVEGNAD